MLYGILYRSGGIEKTNRCEICAGLLRDLRRSVARFAPVCCEICAGLLRERFVGNDVLQVLRLFYFLKPINNEMKASSSLKNVAYLKNISTSHTKYSQNPPHGARG